eukprot:15222-Pelagomonas_calceolata.AAC.1
MRDEPYRPLLRASTQRLRAVWCLLVCQQVGMLPTEQVGMLPRVCSSTPTQPRQSLGLHASARAQPRIARHSKAPISLKAKCHKPASTTSQIIVLVHNVSGSCKGADMAYSLFSNQTLSNLGACAQA